MNSEGCSTLGTGTIRVLVQDLGCSMPGKNSDIASKKSDLMISQQVFKKNPLKPSESLLHYLHPFPLLLFGSLQYLEIDQGAHCQPLKLIWEFPEEVSLLGICDLHLVVV